MQTSGIGNSSHSDMHHVTNCIHNHKHRVEGKVVGGGAGATTTTTQPVTTSVQQTFAPFSLSAWLQNTLSGAKKLLGQIWGSDAEKVSGDVVAKSGTETLTDIATQNTTDVAQAVLNVQSDLQQSLQQEPYRQQDMNTLHRSQIEAASALVQPVQSVNNNPYFAALTEESIPQQSVWQKIKVRFQNITGFLAKRFSFAGGGTFQTKQERPKEDLRRHSRYRKDDVEIECIITDDSYLMDSYNKKGEYSKLSAGK